MHAEQIAELEATAQGRADRSGRAARRELSNITDTEMALPPTLTKSCSPISQRSRPSTKSIKKKLENCGRIGVGRHHVPWLTIVQRGRGAQRGSLPAAGRRMICGQAQIASGIVLTPPAATKHWRAQSTTWQRTKQSRIAQRIEDRLLEQLREAVKERDDAVKAINDLKELQILSETQYRELQEIVPTGVFKAAMGAEAVFDYLSSRCDLDQLALQLREQMQSTSEVKVKKATKRLRVVEALRKSGNKPTWMIFTALPVIPPDLRPMVQLDGGRFATSDLNDLYRRVINRNNRLQPLARSWCTGHHRS